MSHAHRFAITFFTACFCVVAIRTARAGEDWLPVSPEDLALKDNPAQPGSSAMILYRESVVNAKMAKSVGDSIDEYYRIKIFTQDATKQGNNRNPIWEGWLGSYGHPRPNDPP